MLLSVIIPCYNESMVIERTHYKLIEILSDDGREKGYSYELIFVDDGSRDETLEIIQSCAKEDHHTKYISFAAISAKKLLCWQALNMPPVIWP